MEPNVRLFRIIVMSSQMKVKQRFSWENVIEGDDFELCHLSFSSERNSRKTYPTYPYAKTNLFDEFDLVPSVRMRFRMKEQSCNV